MRIIRRLGNWLSSKPARSAQRTRFRLAVEMLENRLSPSVNPIIAENLLPGNPSSEWDIGQGNGDLSIQGYATDISVDQGQAVQFKINDTALAAYHIDIYRIGYYGGMGARKVATIGSGQTLRVAQPAPLTDPSTGLVDAGNWSVTASWAVPSTAVSGVYIAKLVREDTGGASHIIFVVRDDDGQSDVLFQTSDSTWQAYNGWGGNSFYVGSPAGRAYKLSYNRPFDTRGRTAKDWFFSSEYAAVRWMEANGYNVSYFTNVDSARRGQEILEHKAFLSVGHDEYWSSEQWNSVEAARDAGVNLAFLSGNEVYWKTRWETSIDGSGAAYRTLVCYKETWANAKIDPVADVWTGTWRDPRFSPPADGGQPENSLTGTIFTVNRGPAGDTGTPFTVPAEYAGLRFWRNTTVAALQPGQVATLGDYVLGYEWDEDLDNGFRPAGLVPMSATTQNVPSKIDAFGGINTTPGIATHALTLYRAPSGALVFGAGTVHWAWGLDGMHDVILSTPDAAIRQATVNLFADMGVQPGTLQPGLVAASMSTDISAPTSSITSISSGSTYTAGSSVIINGTASDTGGGIVGVVEVSTDGGVTWHRASGRTNWTYIWVPTGAGPKRILSRAADDSANKEIPSAGVDVTVQLAPTSSSGLVAAYSFNAGSGTSLADSSGTGNNGTVSGATWVSAGRTGFGNALSFDGADDLVSIADSNSLDLTNGMTLEAWVKPADQQGWTTLLMKERTGDALAYALYSSDNTNNPPAGYIFGSGGENRIGATSSLPLNVWSHLTLTYNGSMLQMYVNGTLVSSQSASGGISTSTGALRIGGNTVFSPEEYFKGLIDEVRIYNRALSAAEISYNMSTPVGGTNDTSAPAISISSPSNGASVSGTVSVTTTTADNVSIAGVQFFLDGQPFGLEDVSAPFTMSWDTRTVTNGSHTLSARARDIAGNVTTSTDVSVTVSNAADTTAPVVDFLYPATGSRVSGTAILSAFASDNVGVVGVQFKQQGNNIGSEQTLSPYQVAWNTTTVSDGTYSVTATARDAAGNTSTATASITVDNTAPTVISRSPAAGATDVSPGSNITATFGESMQPGSYAFVLRDSGGGVVTATVSYDDATRTVTLNPGQDLGLGETYTVTLSNGKDLAGNTMATVSWTFTTNGTVTNASFWNGSATPSNPSIADSAAIELGIKFQSTVEGYVTGLRFYKGTGNIGTHVGHLWTSTGTLLATATFSNETSTGWQQVNFTSPVLISADATYVASYHAPSGGYAGDSAYFTSSFSNGPLVALSGSNGVYLYGTGGGFPTNSFNSTNYWVDVVFSNTLGDIVAPTVLSQTPNAGATGVAKVTNVTATFSEPVQSNTISFVLRDSNNNAVAANVAYDNTSHVVTLDPTSDLADFATYTATLSGAKDAAGNTMTSVSWPFTTGGVDTGAPVVLSRSPAAGTTGVFPGANVTATFNESIQFGDPQLSFVLKNPSNNTIAAQLKYNDVTRVLTLDPSSDLAASTTYTVTLSGVKDLSGNTMTSTSWSFTTASALTNATVWSNSVVPAVASVNDASPVELGMKFRATQDGYITGLRFYKGPANTGTHIGHLWTAAGSLLANVTFTGETSGGWQQVNFGAPVAITANSTYVASYYAPNGGYAANSGYFSSAVTSGPLRALANNEDGGNGVYRYGAGGGFPSLTFNGSNYWVDVVFANTAADLAAPTVVARTPASGATNVSTGTSVTATLSESVQAGTISFVLKDAANNTVTANFAYDDTTRVATLTPTNVLTGSATYTATLSGAQDAAGNTMAPVSWSFTTGGVITNASLWNLGSTPAVVSAADASAVELGLKFRADRNGTITGLRFYKGAGNTGTHVGHLWTSSGSLLGTATFTGETASGWQQVTFSTPITITANTTYVASYYAPNGGYSYDHGYFNAAFTNGPLRALATSDDNGNGVYRYGSGGGFPSATYNAANYWIDVIFSEVVGDSTAPTVTSRSPAAGASGVVTTTNVSATLSEVVQPGTISLVLKDQNNATVAASVSYNESTRTVTLDPNVDLLPLTTYTATLTGATDLAGNIMAPVTWSFTVQGIWTQTTLSDFSGGTHEGTIATSEDGGALQMAAEFADEFSGTALNTTQWGTQTWSSGNSIAVASGVLSVQGSLVISANTFSGKAIEGSIKFGATPYQHFGLATSFNTVANDYWAVFSTMGSSSNLFARVNALGNTQDVDLGALPTGFHNYRIEPTASGFKFYVDGSLKTTIAITFPSGTPLRIALSAYDGSPAPALQAESIRVASYGSTATYTSTVFDAGQSVTWQSVNWAASAPAGTSVKIEISVSDSLSTGWSDWAEVANGNLLSAVTGRYIRYRVIFTTTDPTQTAVLDDISITWL